VIVRLMGEGQFELDEEACNALNALDDAAVSALESSDEEAFRARLRELAQAVRDRGTQLEDADLRPSDAIVPPDDLSLEEARELFSGEGLIPDLPV
jgi:chromosome condensin MukBEF complex kleisin-like MukF subunit